MPAGRLGGTLTDINQRSAMHIRRVQIKNLRNFKALDVSLQGDTVVLGENRVGKSNFLFALRLVLDANLPDAARQLKAADIWDGCDFSQAPQVEVHLDFADFDADAALLSLLTDYRIAEDHTVARLSYVFRKKAEVEGAPKSEADYEFLIFGGDDETRSVKRDVRLRISLNLLPALRDAEGELGNWRTSPLRPLLEDVIARVPAADLAAIADDLSAATGKLGALAPVRSLETSLRDDVAELAGKAQDIRAKLGFAPSDPLRVFRSIGLFIDDGKRGISDASLGSANLALLALRLAEFEWRQTRNERNYTFLCIEEPEAHLHPHLQRKIFNHLFSEAEARDRSLFLTTHSPNVVSVAPLKSIVVLRHSGGCAQAYSLANLHLTAAELEDLQRYIDTTRADLLFSRGVLFVEGDAEAALLPIFAKALGYDLDALGVAVCNVAGVHFGPYLKLAVALGMAFAVITDWDDVDPLHHVPLGKTRSLGLINAIRAVRGKGPVETARWTEINTLPDDDFRQRVATAGIYLNSSTLEVEVAQTPGLRDPLLDVLEQFEFGPKRRTRLQEWRAGTPVDGEQLLSMIGDIGKGRLAGRLAGAGVSLPPPAYIKAAIERVVAHV